MCKTWISAVNIFYTNKKEENAFDGFICNLGDESHVISLLWKYMLIMNIFANSDTLGGGRVISD